MIQRASFGWQTTMADLALILFMITAAGVHVQQQQREAKVIASPSPRGEPLAVYIVHPGAPPLAEWLDDQAPDGRQQLTIVARYRAGYPETASERALALAEEAGEAGLSARIVLEPGKGEEVLATLAFDRPGSAVARSLQHPAKD